MTNNTIPACPVCGMENTYPDGESFICPDCAHEWSANVASDQIEEKRIHKDAHGNIFNDGAFEIFTEKGTKAEEVLFLDQGQPLIFGANKDKGIRLNGHKPEVVKLGEGISADDVRGMFEDDPQMAADTIRRIGTEMYSDRWEENKAVIR